MTHLNFTHIRDLIEAQRRIGTAIEYLAMDDGGYLMSAVRDELARAIVAIQTAGNADMQIGRTEA
ncbi:hypothetical protein JCM19000A_32620 [Silvimonas sp. JCM 19000]